MTISLKANAAGTQGELQLNGNPVAEFTANTVNFPGLAQSLSGNGYAKLPGGLIIQWGVATANSTGVTITYPVPFPIATAVVVATVESINPSDTVQVSTKTQSGFNLLGNGGAAFFVNWIALGL